MCEVRNEAKGLNKKAGRKRLVTQKTRWRTRHLHQWKRHRTNCKTRRN